MKTATNLTLLAVLVLTTVHAEEARAQQPPASAREEAQQHFRRGVELFGEENYRAALIEFQRAYQISPSFQVLYNIGQVQFLLQDYAAALRAFEKFLADGGPLVAPARKAEVEREIAKLHARVATVEVKTTAGASVVADDMPLGQAPLPPFLLGAGRHRIRASAPGRMPVEKTIDVVGGDKVTVDLTLEEVPAPPPAPTPVVVTPPAVITDARPSSNTKWWLWGAAGVLAVGAGVTGIIALDSSNNADNIRTKGGSFSDYESAQNRMRSFGLAADILGGVAIVTAGIALYFTLTSSPKTGSAQPAILVGPRGAALLTRF